jgi:hypothetical protein
MLKEIPDESVDVMYIDPPFNSNRNYGSLWGIHKRSVLLRIDLVMRMRIYNTCDVVKINDALKPLAKEHKSAKEFYYTFASFTRGSTCSFQDY